MKTMIGTYGPWAESLLPDRPGPLSLQHCPPEEFALRRTAAKARVLVCMAPPVPPEVGAAEVVRRWEHDGLAIEAVTWRLPHGRTEDRAALEVIAKPCIRSGGDAAPSPRCDRDEGVPAPVLK
jgi:hypothetical protein